MDKHDRERWICFYEGMLIMVIPGKKDKYFPVFYHRFYHESDKNTYKQAWGNWHPIGFKKGHPFLFETKKEIYDAFLEHLIKTDEKSKSFYLKDYSPEEFEEDMNHGWNQKTGIQTNMEKIAVSMVEDAWDRKFEVNEVIREGIPFKMNYYYPTKKDKKSFLPENSDELEKFLEKAFTLGTTIIPSFTYIKRAAYQSIKTKMDKGSVEKDNYYVISIKDGYVAGFLFNEQKLMRSKDEMAALRFLSEDQAIEYALLALKRLEEPIPFEVIYIHSDIPRPIYLDERGAAEFWLSYARKIDGER